MGFLTYGCIAALVAPYFFNAIILGSPIIMHQPPKDQQVDLNSRTTRAASDSFPKVKLMNSGKLPTKIVQSPEDSKVFLGKSAVFRCNAKADETLELNIHWLFNGQEIDFDQNPRIVQLFDNSLIITRTAKLDLGVYTCVASTEIDEDTAEATLTFLSVPNAPHIVNLVCGTREARLEWTATSSHHAPIISYKIQFNTSFTPDVWEDVLDHIPGTALGFTVLLSPWANYTFRIIASNEAGHSVPSSPSTKCQTPEDVPYKTPDHVTGYGNRPDQLSISWNPMPPIEQNGPRFFYKVFWKRDDPSATWETQIITEWNRSHLDIEQQETYKPYRLRVEAHNKNGQANIAATEVIGYSGEDVPREAPQHFRLLSIKDAKSAYFSWDPVNPESVQGQLKGYKIESWTPEEEESQCREQIVPSNITDALVTILRPNSKNLVRVRIFNKMYNGPVSNVIEFTTPEEPLTTEFLNELFTSVFFSFFPVLGGV